MSGEAWISVGDAARYLNRSEDSVHSYYRRGMLTERRYWDDGRGRWTYHYRLDEVAALQLKKARGWRG